MSRSTKRMISVEEQNIIDATENTDGMETPAGGEMTDVKAKITGEVLGEGKDSPVEVQDNSQTPEALAGGVEVEFKKIAEGQTEIENKVQALTEIENVAIEMMKIVEKNGALTAMEAMMVEVALNNAVRNLPEELRGFDLPSMENYTVLGLAASSTEVSLEGVLDKISTLMNNITLSIEKQIKNAFGFIGSFTPLINRLMARAVTVKGMLKDSNREAGLKEIKFKQIKTLIVDGKVPEGKTVIQTLKAHQQVITEILSTDAEDAIIGFIKESNAALSKGKVAEKDYDDVNFTPNAVTVAAVTYPSIFKLFPSAAKMQTAGVHGYTDDNMEFRRSVPLFGNVAAVTYSNKENPKTNNVTVVWAPGLTFERLGDTPATDTAFVLTHKEQVQVIDGVIAELSMTLEFWKSYANRNKKVMQMYQQVHKQWLNDKNNSGMLSLQRDVSRFAKDMAVYYKAVLFGARYAAAMNVKGTTSMLISYVEASARATQADTAE